MVLSRRFLILVFVLLIFFAGLWQGLRIAFNKPLWNDEQYTQISSVEGKSWKDIWTGGVGEGNNSPIFYSFQKITCNIFNYKSDDLWNKQSIPSRFILRIVPVFCMSLGLALIVWFFCSYYSLLGGLIAFIVSISSYMVWYYWAEARPYALIFLATTLQSLALLYYYRFENKSHSWSVGVANLFLALVSSLSVIQIAASVIVLWFKGDRRWRSLLGYVGLPLAIAFGYYMKAAHYPFWFASYGQPLNLIQASIPSGRLVAFFTIPVLIWIWDWRVNQRKGPLLWPFFIWGWLTLMGYCLFLGYLFLNQHPPKGFEVSNRYLMPLTPVGIIIVTLGILELVKLPKSIWIKIIIWFGVLAVILPRLLKTWGWMTRGL